MCGCGCGNSGGCGKKCKPKFVYVVDHAGAPYNLVPDPVETTCNNVVVPGLVYPDGTPVPKHVGSPGGGAWEIPRAYVAPPVAPETPWSSANSNGLSVVNGGPFGHTPTITLVRDPSACNPLTIGPAGIAVPAAHKVTKFEAAYGVSNRPAVFNALVVGSAAQVFADLLPATHVGDPCRDSIIWFDMRFDLPAQSSAQGILSVTMDLIFGTDVVRMVADARQMMFAGVANQTTMDRSNRFGLVLPAGATINSSVTLYFQSLTAGSTHTLAVDLHKRGVVSTM